MALPFVTVAVPVLNEAAGVEAVIRSLVPEGIDHEIMVLDGGSTDGTRDIVARLERELPTLRLVANEGRTQGRAVNLAATLADPRASVLVRADAHCTYPEGFVAKIVTALKETGAQSVVVPMFTVGEDGRFQRAAAAAQNSKIGNGGSAHRSAGGSRWVDHGHHAAFDLETFRRLGGYDAEFATNEDAEYDLRLAGIGGRVWMETPARIDYHPRKSPLALARQYFRYGRGRAMTVIKHGVMPKLRQLAPLVILFACLGGLLLSSLHPVFALVPVLYLAACMAVGMTVVGIGVDALAVGTAAAIMHLSWGAGFAATCCLKIIDRIGSARSGKISAEA